MISEVRTKATTIASQDGRAMAIVLVLCGAFAAVFPLFDRAHWWVWAKHIPLVPAVIADLAVFAIASAWVLYWGFRLGVRIDDDGVTVHRIVKMDRYAWLEVSRFADGYYKTGHGEKIWALDVVLVDGQAVTLTATARKEIASPKMLTAIGEVAARYQIPAELTGTPQTRDGSPGQSLALSRAIGHPTGTSSAVAHNSWHLDALVLVTIQGATHYEGVAVRCSRVQSPR